MKQLFYFFVCSLLAVSCRKDRHDDHHSEKRDVIYFQSNDFNGNSNKVLAYQMTENGSLEQIAGSPFSTGGSGVGNPMQLLGPSDSDTELKLSDDGKFLVVANSGSNNITVFEIKDDGSLMAVPGSPFPSGGETPVSIDVKGQYVYVVNKSQDPLKGNKLAPNYSVFTINGAGALSTVASSTVNTNVGSSPAQALVSNDGKFLFGADFLGFMVDAGTLRSFTIANDGKITSLPNYPQAIPGMGGALGLWQHANANILYVGFPVQGKVGVYGINSSSGALNFKSTLDAGPAACWIRGSADGKYLYTLNSGENTISMFNSSTAESPASLGKFTLKNPGPLYTAMGMSFTTSQPFSFEFSSDQKYLFVLNQHTNTDFSIGNYNMLHTLVVGNDGKLSEPLNQYRYQLLTRRDLKGWL